MTRLALATLITILVSLLGACCAVTDWIPAPAQTSTATPCPPASTPERSMPAEAAVLRAALEAQGVLGASVYAIGMQNCPGLPAESVAWFEIRMSVDDVTDNTRAGELAEAITRAAAPDWPTVTIHLRLTDSRANRFIPFRMQDALAARQDQLHGQDFLHMVQPTPHP